MLCASIIIRIHIFFSQIVCMVFVIRLTKKCQNTGADPYYLMLISSSFRIFSVTSIIIFFIYCISHSSFLQIHTCNHIEVYGYYSATILDIGQCSNSWNRMYFRSHSRIHLLFHKYPTSHLPRFAHCSRNYCCIRCCYYFHNHFYTYF